MGKHSKYKGVTWGDRKRNGKSRASWVAVYDGPEIPNRWRKKCDTEREAAIAYDKKMIELGLPPVNILKPRP